MRARFTLGARWHILVFRKAANRKAPWMESIFTLVIALGGIATGIGAIWTALVARRQALLTEQALLEQRRSLKEQEDRARLSFEMDMLFRLADRFESPAFLWARRAAAGYVKEHFFTDKGGLSEVEYLDQTLARLLNFFEELGQFVRAEGLRTESVWNRFGWRTRRYWTLYRPAIEKLRKEQGDPTLLEDFEQLNDSMADLDDRHGVGRNITKQQLRWFVELEALAGQEGSDTGE